MRTWADNARRRFEAKYWHCSRASSSSIPLTFSPGLRGLLRSPSFCLSVMCWASSCITVTVCLVANTHTHFIAKIGNSGRIRCNAWPTTRSSVESKARRSVVLSFFASGSSASGADRFLAPTRAGMITKLSERKDFLSFFSPSRSTIQRSPCQLKTSPNAPLYFAAFVKPWTTTRLPGSSSAVRKFSGFNDNCAPLLVVTVTRSAFPGLGPREEQYSSFSSGFDAKPMI
mmetsp:Transcript_52893/g.104370  ORF Transcript_52893/g.104370 Transcript_52893/m.104370 type:complete len:229 (-) Transcript_52893:85-771(-)